MAVPTQTAMLYVHSDANAYACKRATKLYWIPPAMQVMVTQCLMMKCLFVECIDFWGDVSKAERYLVHVTFLIWSITGEYSNYEQAIQTEYN